MNKKALISLSSVALVVLGFVMVPAANANPYWGWHARQIHQEQRVARRMAAQRYYAQPYVNPYVNPYYAPRVHRFMGIF